MKISALLHLFEFYKILSIVFIVNTFFGCFWSKRSWAFPELTRYGYVNCTACHIAPTGGGILNQYGRESSQQILSTFGRKNENEPKFAYGIVQLPDGLNAMGIYRGVYAHQNTPFITQSKYIFMEADAEAALQIGNQWFFDATLGYENLPTDTTFSDHVISRRHFVNYRPLDELSFRVGRFFPQYGILTPNHILATRRDLGWNEGQETYNIEGAYLGEKINFFLTGILGRPDQPSLKREQGIAATPSISLNDTYKIGVSYYYGNAASSIRNLTGIWGILGFSRDLFLLTEWDYQVQSLKSSVSKSTQGFIHFNQFDYQILQGFHIFLLQDFSKLDLSDLNTLHNSFGLGIQFFPRPHFEIYTVWQKLKTQRVVSDYTGFAYIMLNVYI